MSRQLDIHGKDISIQLLQQELCQSPSRIEEPKRVLGYGGCTPLIAAVLHGNCEVAHFFITNGARIDATDNVRFC